MDPLERQIQYTRTGKPRKGFGLWLARERLTRKAQAPREWTSAALRKRLRAQRGYDISHSGYAAIETSSREPTEEQYRHLTEFFGTTPDPEPADESGGLAAAIREQTVAIRELVAEMREAREHRGRDNAHPDVRRSAGVTARSAARME